MTIARYSYYPWLRRGIANELQIPASGSARAALDVTLNVASDVATDSVPPKQVQLVGPGDVIGINPLTVVRTEPRNWITDFEPNFLAFVEFYDEDFVWRYTPAAPDVTLHRLTPWISLLVLKDGEFTRNTSPARPLPSVTLNGISAAQVLPQDSQLYAWAHVHVNAASGAGHTPDLAALSALLRSDPDRGYSRLVSPRRLEANTGYWAFVIPTFEVGRKAGLGEPVADTEPGLVLAWSVATEFPVYYDWFFRTGAAGDFEELVRALKPRPIDKRVGIRDLDIQQPGFLMPPITSAPDDTVGIEGALLSPFSEPEPLDPASNFPAEIERVVNLAADFEQTGVTAGDPVVTAPLYGRWHALVSRMSADPAQRNWVNELNVDPRHRAVAGFGTRVIQHRQEEYMKLAWQQIGEVLAANRRIHFVQMALKASQAAYVKNLVSLPVPSTLAITKPVHAKVMGSPTTVAHLVAQSQLPAAALSGAFRKQLRPRGPIAARAFPATAQARPYAAVVNQLNDGSISAAPPREEPTGPTLQGVVDQVKPHVPDFLRLLAANRLLLLVAALMFAALLVLLGPVVWVSLLGPVVALVGWFAYLWLGKQAQRVEAGDALEPTAFTPEAVERIPPRPTFVLSPPGRPDPVDPEPVPAPVPADSPDARDFRKALVAFHGLLEYNIAPLPARSPLTLDKVTRTVMSAVEPAVAMPRRLAPLLRVGSFNVAEYIGANYRDEVPMAPVPRVVPVMAYPDIRKPMYEPLRDISSDLLVPNLHLIAPNTISLMVKNQRFIEAYMVGLNHEFARELLWREYPTDQRPSTFRQFWDVSTAVNIANVPPKEFEESLRDITRLHEWSSESSLGAHDNRRSPNDPPETGSTPLLKRSVVLVIRGDLLKRYPNTIIYAQRAKWGEGTDYGLRLVLWDETGEGINTNPSDPNVRLPLFKASVLPDIHFIGFNLSVEEVRGAPNLEETQAAKAAIPASKLGWFFVLQEVVGEPRFGLDENPPEEDAPLRWDNISWDHLGPDVDVIDVGKPFVLPLTGDDEGIQWGANSADMASILYQKPVLVAVHAREMLTDKVLEVPT
jgi:hypothetical protein